MTYAAATFPSSTARSSSSAPSGPQTYEVDALDEARLRIVVSLQQSDGFLEPLILVHANPNRSHSLSVEVDVHGDIATGARLLNRLAAFAHAPQVVQGVDEVFATLPAISATTSSGSTSQHVAVERLFIISIWLE